MRAYFDLCSEEYYLWKNKNVDEDTWKEWESGIKFTFSKPAFKQAWSVVKLDTIYYGEFSNYINDRILEPWSCLDLYLIDIFRVSLPIFTLNLSD